jgi:predicted dithiol-disulfide oxidoreductase (DUF899 family)
MTSFPGESPEYRTARDALLEREIALRREMEAVAAARRELPPGGAVTEDYVFQGARPDGEPAEIRMSELFAPGTESLAIYNYMFPRSPQDPRPGPESGLTAELPLAQGPCPSCTALLDQLDAVMPHSDPLLNFCAVAGAPIEHVLAFARERGWRHMRVLSAAGNGFKRDYHGETEDGSQIPMLNVFHRDGDTIRHFWSSEVMFAPTDGDQDPRHVGTIEPLWNLIDLTREGRRPDWNEQLSYR